MENRYGPKINPCRRAGGLAGAVAAPVEWPPQFRAGGGAPSKMKIRRIRYYEPPRVNPTFNQSDRIVTVETDAGITGIGEGGSKDMLEQCAAMLIGEDPSRIEHLWQMMYRGYFYPPGREKLHALGALDLALWDIKGKALGVPVYELLGGLSRDYIECYSTGFPSQGAQGNGAGLPRGRIPRLPHGLVGAVKGTFNARQVVEQTFEHCQQVREGVGHKATGRSTSTPVSTCRTPCGWPR